MAKTTKKVTIHAYHSEVVSLADVSGAAIKNIDKSRRKCGGAGSLAWQWQWPRNPLHHLAVRVHLILPVARVDICPVLTVVTMRWICEPDCYPRLQESYKITRKEMKDSLCTEFSFLLFS